MKTNHLNQHPASCDIITKHHDLTDLTLFSRLKSSTSSSSQWDIMHMRGFLTCSHLCCDTREESHRLAWPLSLTCLSSGRHITSAIPVSWRLSGSVLLLLSEETRCLCEFTLTILHLLEHFRDVPNASVFCRAPWLFITTFTVKEKCALHLTGEKEFCHVLKQKVLATLYNPRGLDSFWY